MKPENVKRTLLAIASALFALAACKPNTEQGKHTPTALPFFGNHDLGLVDDGKGGLVPDTLYFTVPYFSFSNQHGEEVTADDYSGHIVIVDFFFTSCPTICPVMSSQMSRLQNLLRKEHLLGDVKLLSHTVDPHNDTPEVLRAYGERLGADFEHWTFLTGEQDELYYQARFGYFLTALPSDTAAGGFFHSDTFVLVDRQGHLRGYYDGTSTQAVDQLFNDLKSLVEPHP